MKYIKLQVDLAQILNSLLTRVNDYITARIDSLKKEPTFDSDPEITSLKRNLTVAIIKQEIEEANAKRAKAELFVLKAEYLKKKLPNDPPKSGRRVSDPPIRDGKTRKLEVSSPEAKSLPPSGEFSNKIKGLENLSKIGEGEKLSK